MVKQQEKLFFPMGIVLFILGLTALIFHWSKEALLLGQIMINTKSTGIFLIVIGIASFLAQKMQKHREVISRIFLDLQEKELAKCTNPESPHFRYYKITKKGKKVLGEIIK